MERLSEIAGIVGYAAPISQGAGNLDTGWVAARDFEQFLAICMCGVLGASATVDAKLQQASDSSGTGAEDITSKAVTQLVKASDDGKIVAISLLPTELVGSALSFRLGTATHFRMRIAVGTAASLVAGIILGFRQKNDLVTALDLAAVKQIVQ